MSILVLKYHLYIISKLSPTDFCDFVKYKPGKIWTVMCRFFPPLINKLCTKTIGSILELYDNVNYAQWVFILYFNGNPTWILAVSNSILEFVLWSCITLRLPQILWESPQLPANDNKSVTRGGWGSNSELRR